ncbi:Aste57867_18446 [Aphanomyces stellatus]|uniref:Aste57867_18446 protein n=1 Tax=Aphanomyces stellatus TaxID=120398 RepID=A0A485LAZ5_9STRA|nr:hypothetical protein As57867_018384 [Aphanomyces stellatus]VFT95182.1 Aste57867_18446 [Aphanomyces stellatus]
MSAMIYPIPKDAPRKRRLSAEEMKNHPIYDRFAHIKTKRVKELGFMSHLIPELQRQIVQLKRQQTSQLSWEDVTQALKDDTLEQVRDNRTLRQEIEINAHICGYLQTWLAHVHPAAMSPNYVVDNWRHSSLFKGDESARQVGFKWITRQAYHNTERVLSTVSFPSPTADSFIDVRTIVTEANAVVLQVATQHIVSYPMELVADAYWQAEKTFGEFMFKGQYTPPTIIASLHDDVDYTHEEVGTDEQRISDKVLMGRFCDDHRMVCVIRSVMNDEVYPLAANAWTTDTRQWTVVERLGPEITRVRMYYSIDHPCTTEGYVPLWEYARAMGVRGIDDAEVIERLKMNREQRHVRSRGLFAQHFNNTLQTMADTRDEQSI